MNPFPRKCTPDAPAGDDGFRSVPAHNLVRILSGEMPVPSRQHARPARDSMWDNLDGPPATALAKAPAKKKRAWFF